MKSAVGKRASDQRYMNKNGDKWGGGEKRTFFKINEMNLTGFGTAAFNE
jgi:hypothetical protein